jgi:hypothetical protein
MQKKEVQVSSEHDLCRSLKAENFMSRKKKKIKAQRIQTMSMRCFAKTREPNPVDEKRKRELSMPYSRTCIHNTQCMYNIRDIHFKKTGFVDGDL